MTKLSEPEKQHNIEYGNKGGLPYGGTGSILQSIYDLEIYLGELDKTIQKSNQQISRFNLILGVLTLILVIFTVGIFFISLRQVGIV